MAIHYVATDGSGDFTTIAQVNAHTFSPGDSVLFRKGDVWRETLEVPNSGTVGSYITFGNYGSGANPKILGSTATTTWTDQGSNKWKCDLSFTTSPHSLYPNYADITFINKDTTRRFGLYKANTASLAAEYDWTWVSNYIYVYAKSNPAYRYTGIEVPQRRFGVSTNDNQYLAFNGIDVYYCADIGYDTNSDHGDHTHIHGCTIENCRVGFIGGIGDPSNTAQQVGYGIALNYSDLIIRSCEVHNCGRRSISLDLYGNGFTQTTALVEMCYLHDGYHTTGVDINVGAGGSYTANWDGITIRRNKIYDPLTSTILSNQIFIQNSNRAVASLSNVYINSNIFMYPSFAAINMEGTQSVYVYNNTFYEVGSVTSNAGYQLWIDTNNALVEVKNNIFYCTSSVRTNGHGAAIYCASTYANCDIDYNCYYRINNTLDMIIAGSTYYMNTAFPISGNGWEANGKKANPTFADTTNYRIQTSSQAKYAGVNLSLSLDYAGNSYANPPSMGAYEYGVEAPGIHYVAVGGGGDGTAASPFATIAQVNAHTFIPGDSIYFNKGDTWRESLTINQSGSAGNWLTFGYYGTGNRPRILGSNISTWSAEGHTNIWVCDSTLTYDPSKSTTAESNYGSDLWFDSAGTITEGILKTYSSNFSNLTAEYHWTYNANKVYIYAVTDPNSRYTSVEIPQRDFSIDYSGRQYIYINGLDCRYQLKGGLTGDAYGNYSYLTVRDCHVGYSAKITPNVVPNQDNKGISAVYSHLLIQYCEVHDMGRRSISLYNYGSTVFTVTDNIIENCTLYNGNHTTGIDIACGSGNADFDGIIIRKNLIYDSATAWDRTNELINIEGYAKAGTQPHNIEIYDNILMYPQNSSIHLYGVLGAHIYNNTFVGHNTVKSDNMVHIRMTAADCTGVIIKNNIFYSLNSSSTTAICSIYTSSAITTANITADYNIYYRPASGCTVMSLRGETQNYHYNDLALIRSNLGWEAHGQFADPSFVSSVNFRLNSNSPAIGAGTNVSLSTDYEDKAWANPPSLGAYENTAVVYTGAITKVKIHKPHVY